MAAAAKETNAGERAIDRSTERAKIGVELDFLRGKKWIYRKKKGITTLHPKKEIKKDTRIKQVAKFRAKKRTKLKRRRKNTHTQTGEG